LNKDEIIAEIKSYFESKSDAFDRDMAFLYGSRAAGFPKEELDVDIAVMFYREMEEREVFEILTTISVELTEHLKKEISVLFIDRELSKPMVHYNAIAHGVPVYIGDFMRFFDMKLKAIHKMEDFCVFGMKWQSEIVRKRLEALNRA